MTARRRILGAAAGAVGLAAAGAVLGINHQSRAIRRRKGDATPFGTLRSRPVTIIADDGVPLHVEVDELDADLPQPASGLTSWKQAQADADCREFDGARLAAPDTLAAYGQLSSRLRTNAAASGSAQMSCSSVGSPASASWRRNDEQNQQPLRQ